MKYLQLPSQEVLRYLFYFNHSTGILYSRFSSCQWKIGRRGAVNLEGYYQRKIDQRHYYEHRLVWMYVYGIDPGNYVVDHIDGDRSNNRLSNLRLCTIAENNWQNKYLSCSPLGKWVAHFKLDGRDIDLGSYDTKGEARSAYIKARNDLIIQVAAGVSK